jgi:hypothetical protein
VIPGLFFSGFCSFEAWIEFVLTIIIEIGNIIGDDDFAFRYCFSVNDSWLAGKLKNCQDTMYRFKSFSLANVDVKKSLKSKISNLVAISFNCLRERFIPVIPAES